MEIHGAGAVLVLAEIQTSVVHRAVLIASCWSVLGFAGCFCTFWFVVGPSFQGFWLLSGKGRIREDSEFAACSSLWQNRQVLLSISRRIQPK